MDQKYDYYEEKMVRKWPTGYHIKRIPLPLPILEQHKDLKLYINFSYINGYLFFATKSSKVDFITQNYCTSRTKQQIIKKSDTVIDKYKTRGFNITAVDGDKDFNVDDIKEFLLPILTHIYEGNEHVGIIGRVIHVIKEQYICIYYSILLRYWTKWWYKH